MEIQCFHSSRGDFERSQAQPGGHQDCQSGPFICLPLPMFYTLNSCKIPQKYQDFYQNLDPKISKEISDIIWRVKYQLPDLSDDVFRPASLSGQTHFNAFKKFKENRGIPGLLLKLKSIKDRLKDPGITVSPLVALMEQENLPLLEKTRVMLSRKIQAGSGIAEAKRPSILPILSCL